MNAYCTHQGIRVGRIVAASGSFVNCPKRASFPDQFGCADSIWMLCRQNDATPKPSRLTASAIMEVRHEEAAEDVTVLVPGGRKRLNCLSRPCNHYEEQSQFLGFADDKEVEKWMSTSIGSSK